MSSLSVLVVSYRTPQHTVNAVQSALDVEEVQEVIVVDNASADATVHLLHRLEDDRVRVIVNANNCGYGTAANQAAAAATGDTLIFLNSDAVLSTAAACALQREVSTCDGRAIVGARLIDADGEIQRSAGLLPGPVDLAIRALGLHHLASVGIIAPILQPMIGGSRIASEYGSATLARSPVATSMVSGACIAIGRGAFGELGGFDQRFFLYFEDADLCRRAAAAGMPIRYLPSATVAHVGGASSSEDYHFGPMHARAMRQYLTKWYGLAGAGAALAILWLRAAGMTLGGRSGAKRAWSAMWAAVRNTDPRW